MSTRSGRVRQSVKDTSPPRIRKGQSPSRSPGRARKASPARKTSPARARKSPSRKSPSRKPSLSRKSPSRPTKDTAQSAAPKSPAKRPIIGKLEVKLEDFSSKIESFRSVRSRRSEYSYKELSSAPQIDFNTQKINGQDITNASDVFGLRSRKLIEEIVPRRSSRLQEFIDKVPDIRRSFSKSVSKSVEKSLSKSISQSLDTYSDEEHSDNEFKEKPVTRKLATPLRDSISKVVQISGKWEFGGRLGTALLIILIPLTVLTILLSCKKSCSIQNFTNTSFHQVQVWFTLEAVAIVLTQILLQAIISVIPVFGTRIERKDLEKAPYFFNAFFASILTVNLIFVLDFFKIFNSSILTKQYEQLAATNFQFFAILSIILFIRSKKIDENNINPYANTGYSLYDFFMGREILPTVWRLNVKIWTSRVSNITSLVLAIVIFKQGFEFPHQTNQDLTLENLMDYIGKVQMKPTLLIFAFMQIVYILNFIMKEYRVTSTFYWHSEGMGYLQLACSALYPYYFTSISKFVADTSLAIPTNILIIAVSVYFIGFIIMSLSNSIKDEFRKNSLDPKFSNLDSMPTFHGKKLLVSHLWGILRHPNYAGDLLIHFALAIPGIVSRQYIAAVPPLLTILILLHRTWRDHARCNRRYGAAWQRYCRRVPSAIIPKIL